MIELIKEIPEGFWTIALTGLSAWLLKIADKHLSRRAENREDNKSYREQIKELQERVEKVEKEANEWREKFWQSREELARFSAALTAAGVAIPEKPPGGGSS